MGIDSAAVLSGFALGIAAHSQLPSEPQRELGAHPKGPTR